MIFDHRHRGNLHIKSWLSTGPLPMLQEAAVPGRQACIGMYHEPHQAARQGPSMGVQESLVAGQHQPVPASQGRPRWWRLRLKKPDKKCSVSPAASAAQASLPLPEVVA